MPLSDYATTSGTWGTDHSYDNTTDDNLWIQFKSNWTWEFYVPDMGQQIGYSPPAGSALPSTGKYYFSYLEWENTITDPSLGGPTGYLLRQIPYPGLAVKRTSDGKWFELHFEGCIWDSGGEMSGYYNYWTFPVGVEIDAANRKVTFRYKQKRDARSSPAIKVFMKEVTSASSCYDCFKQVNSNSNRSNDNKAWLWFNWSDDETKVCRMVETCQQLHVDDAILSCRFSDLVSTDPTNNSSAYWDASKYQFLDTDKWDTIKARLEQFADAGVNVHFYMSPFEVAEVTALVDSTTVYRDDHLIAISASRNFSDGSTASDYGSKAAWVTSSEDKTYLLDNQMHNRGGADVASGWWNWIAFLYANLNERKDTVISSQQAGDPDVTINGDGTFSVQYLVDETLTSDVIGCRVSWQDGGGFGNVSSIDVNNKTFTVDRIVGATPIDEDTFVIEQWCPLAKGVSLDYLTLYKAVQGKGVYWSSYRRAFSEGAWYGLAALHDIQDRAGETGNRIVAHATGQHRVDIYDFVDYVLDVQTYYCGLAWEKKLDHTIAAQMICPVPVIDYYDYRYPDTWYDVFNLPIEDYLAFHVGTSFMAGNGVCFRIPDELVDSEIPILWTTTAGLSVAEHDYMTWLDQIKWWCDLYYNYGSYFAGVDARNITKLSGGSLSWDATNKTLETTTNEEIHWKQDGVDANGTPNSYRAQLSVYPGTTYNDDYVTIRFEVFDTSA